MGFKSIDKPGRSLEVEHNPKRSISFLWLERGGGWGLSPLTCPANHQKLNVIQKVAFHFIGWRGLADGVRVHWPAQLIIRSWTWYKNEHFIFLAGEGWWMGFESIDQPGWSSEVEHNPKMSISFFWLERGNRWGSSSSTSPADHQKWTQSKNEHFIFLAGEGWWMGFESINQLGQSSEVECNPKMSISFFWLERDGRWGLSSLTSLANIRSWM